MARCNDSTLHLENPAAGSLCQIAAENKRNRVQKKIYGSSKTAVSHLKTRAAGVSRVPVLQTLTGKPVIFGAVENFFRRDFP